MTSNPHDIRNGKAVLNDEAADKIKENGYQDVLLDKTGTPFDGVDDIMRDTMSEVLGSCDGHENKTIINFLKEHNISDSLADEFRAAYDKAEPGGTIVMSKYAPVFIKTVTGKILPVRNYVVILEKTLIEFEQFSVFTHLKIAFNKAITKLIRRK